MTPCVEFQGHKNAQGYGRRRYKGKLWRAHRLAWYLEHGDIPDAMVVMHLCDNPSCINPDHLRIGTHQENIDDMKAKGRDNRVGVPRKTHCAKGHELADPNLYYSATGSRSCRACVLDYGRRRHAAKVAT